MELIDLTRVKRGWFWGIVAVLAIAAGIYLAPELTTLGAIILGLGLPIVLLLWHRPEFGVLALIFLTSGFVSADIVDLRLPVGGGLELRDLALLGMLALLMLQRLIHNAFTVPWRRVGLPLLMVLGFGLFSALYAIVYEGVASNWALRDLRALWFYALYFVAGWAIARRGQLNTLLNGMFVIADLTTGIIIIQQFLGADQRFLPAMLQTDWQVWEQNTGTAGFGNVRIVPPGHVLMYFMMVMALGLLLFDQNTRRQRVILAFQFSFLGLGLVLTYTRAQWIATAVAIALVFLIAVAGDKVRFGRHLLLGVSMVLFLYIAWGYQIQDMLTRVPALEALTTRLFSIFTPAETLESLSLEWRVFETDRALRSIAEHPLLGVGLGNSYRELTSLRGEAAGRMLNSLDLDSLYRYTRFLHNSYLSIAVKMGLPALLCLLWLCAAFLTRSWQLYRSLCEGRLKAIVVAAVASFVGLLFWSILHPHFIEIQSTPVLGLMIGLVACAQALHTQVVGPSPAPGQVPARVRESGPAQ